MSNEIKGRILAVDDEQDVTELLQYRLEQSGHECKTINDPLLFVSTAREYKPDLMIFDVMMPELSGLQLCRIVRADPQLKDKPILLLTARSETEDRVKGLETGADDYLSKPFDMRELVLRVNKLLQRSLKNGGADEDARIQIGNVVIDPEEHLLLVDGQEVTLTATEFRLLKLLMSRKGRVQSREHLLVTVWHYDAEIETRTVDTHVRRVREKLGPYADLIETIRGVGYRAIDLPN